jgi:uncharacterized protein (TIGR03435 family)
VIAGIRIPLISVAPGAVGGSASQPGDASGPTLFEALQSQPGLNLVPAAQTEIRVFVIDHVQAVPAEDYLV